MKKFIGLVLALVCVLSMVGCDNTISNSQESNSNAYSFSGENEQFMISNGVIILSDNEEIFCGGSLIYKNEDFGEIASYSTTFYIMSGDEKMIILSNSVEDMTGGTVNIAGDLGKVSGDGIISGIKIDNFQELRDNLYFELITTDLHGEENVYQLKLSLLEDTRKVDN